MNDRLTQFEKYSHLLSKWFNWVAGAAALGILGIVVADILGVKLIKSPVPGAIEIVGYLSIMLVAFATAHTLVIRGHIQIEAFTTKLPPRLQEGLRALISFLNLALFIVIAWQSYEFARILQQTGEVSMTQRIAFYPFVYAIALSSIPVCLVALVELVKSIRKAVQS